MLTRTKTKKIIEKKLVAEDSFESSASCDDPDCGQPECDTKRAAKQIVVGGEDSFESSASCDDPDCGQPECDIKRVIIELRSSRRVPTTFRKLDDGVLSFIYLALYVLAFLLFIEFSVGAGTHEPNKEAHLHLPLQLNCQHIFLETVQRMRALKKPTRQSKFSFKKNVKKAKNVYNLLKSFQKSNELHAYLQTKSKYFHTPKSQLEVCTCVCGVSGIHNMRQRYDRCKCSFDCQFKYKIKMCQKSDVIELFEPIDQANECALGLKSQERQTNGMEPSIKQRIEKMCADDADETAKKILNRLHQQAKRNDFKKSLLPTLRQVNICMWMQNIN